MAIEAKTFTSIDKKILEEIKPYGIVFIDAMGIPFVSGNYTVPSDRFRRLVQLGKVTPNNDGLLDGFSQTYSVNVKE